MLADDPLDKGSSIHNLTSILTINNNIYLHSILRAYMQVTCMIAILIIAFLKLSSSQFQTRSSTEWFL